MNDDDRRTYVDSTGAIVEMRRTRSTSGAEVWIVNSVTPAPARHLSRRTLASAAKGQIERRITDAKITVRTNADGTVGVRGYAAVFDSVSHGEVIKRGAFNRTIAQQDNVRFLINHEGTPLASTRAGTMTIGIDDVGEWFDIPSLDPSNPRAAEFISSVGRGDMYQCSFAGYFRDCPVVDGVREVREVEQVDISGVTFPWYEETSMGLTGDRSLDGRLVSARSADDVLELSPEQRSHAMQALRAAPAGKTSFGDIASELCEAINGMLSVGGAEPYLWIDDLGTDWAVYSIWDGTDWDYYQVAYVANADGTLTIDTPFEVERVTEYRPMTPAEIATDDATEKSYSVAEARALLGLTPAA